MMRGPFIALGLGISLIGCNYMGEPWPDLPTPCTGYCPEPPAVHNDMAPFMPIKAWDLSIPDPEVPDAGSDMAKNDKFRCAGGCHRREG